MKSKMSKENFSVISECTTCDSISVKKFTSSRTGISVVIAKVPGPLVHGCFVIATEAKTDDGLPHTLEHLIFLGSDDYPYKGTLDVIANRCLANGTNAWTEIDNTTYTVSTVGSEGFLQLFPVYLDHLFFPTLTETGFITEVYHVTGDGKDAGVVFCEMKHYESDADALIKVELARGLYAPNCGYRYQTGGLVYNLRQSTSIEKIRKYHEAFYCPENTTLIVAGLIDEDQVLDAVTVFEEKLLQKKANVKFEKAWQRPVSLLNNNVVKAVAYPSDNEDYGTVVIGWQGPSVVNDYYSVMACNVLGAYLTHTAASPLMKHFVESENSICSDISFSIDQNSISGMKLTLENVVIKKIPLLRDELMCVLRSIGEKSDHFQINAERMNTVIQRFAQRQLLALEQDPHYEIAANLISDVLYGKLNTEIHDRLNHETLAEKFTSEPISFWYNLLEKYFINNFSVTVLGYPSKKNHVLETYFENERISARRERLGKDGLAKKAEILKNANQENAKLPPNEVIAAIPIPKIDNLKFHTLVKYVTSGEAQHPQFSLKSAPLFTQLDDIESQFVYLNVLLNSSELSRELRLYLPLLLEYTLQCPIIRNGEQISYETVATELETDVVKIQYDCGINSKTRFSCGTYSEALILSLVVSPKKFERGISWIRELLYCSVFTVDRLKVVVNKLISNISQVRREGNQIVRDLMKIMLFKGDTNYSLCSVLCQLKFLSTILEKLQNTEESETIVKDLQFVARILTQPKNTMLHISTNVNRLVEIHKNPGDILQNVIPKNRVIDNSRVDISQDKEFLHPQLGGGHKSCIVQMASMDSAYVHLATPSIDDFNHPDLAALLVFIQYVTQLEGPLWRDVRGLGLAYHYGVKVSVEEGMLFLVLGRANDPVQAFERTKNIFNKHITSTENWNILLFDSAKTSLIFELAQREKNITDVVKESLISSFRRTSGDYNKLLIRKVNEIRLEDMKRIGQTYISPLTKSESSLITIICHPSKKEDISSGFLRMGRHLLEFSSLEDSCMNIDP